MRLGAGGGAGCGNFRYLYQMVDTQMAGSGIDHIAAVGAGLRGGFRCGSTRVVGTFAILGIAAGAGVPVVGFITAPFARPVMIESRSYYAPMIDDFCKSVSILKELTTLTQALLPPWSDGKRRHDR